MLFHKTSLSKDYQQAEHQVTLFCWSVWCCISNSKQPSSNL